MLVSPPSSLATMEQRTLWKSVFFLTSPKLPLEDEELAEGGKTRSWCWCCCCCSKMGPEAYPEELLKEELLEPSGVVAGAGA